MSWFRLNDRLLDDCAVQTMSAHEFKRTFIAAARGAQNELSAFVRPDSGRPSPAKWSALRSQVFERDDYTCTYCGERGKRLECDHIIPVARGGSHEDDNLTTACFGCNRSKRDKLIEEWRRQ